MVLLGACNGGGGGADDGGSESSGTDASDSGEDSSGGESVDSTDGTTEGGSSETGMPGQTLLELLATIEPGTAWADLDPEVQAALTAHASDRYADGEADWGAQALLDKQAAVVDAPTPAIDANFDLYAIVRLGAPDGHSATSAVTDAALQSALRRTYLIELGFQRSEIAFYYPEPPIDWDGESPIAQYPSVFTGDTHAAQRAYAAQVNADLAAIPADGLAEIDVGMRQRALYITRAIAAGSRSAWGAEELFTPVGLVAFSADPYFIWSFVPDAFADGESYVQHLNALTQLPLQWVDVGTTTAARDYWFPSVVNEEEASEVLGDETLARYHTMLMGWWLERLEAEPDATKACTVYSEDDRAAIMDGFAGNMSFDPADEMALADLQPMTTTFATDLGGQYRAAAHAAIDSVFADDALLTGAQRLQVHAAIDDTQEFGALISTIEAALDDATGGTAASDAFRAALAELEVLELDENGEITPELQARVDTMWTEVRDYLVASNAGYVVDYEAALPPTIDVNADFSSYATPEGITIGLGVTRTTIEWYSTMLHEAHHVVNYNAGLVVEGAAIEGAANIASRAELGQLLLDVTSPLEAAVGQLSLVSSDARLVGFTDATLGVLLRDDCTGPDTIAYATDIAAGWGVSDEDLPLAPYRAHAGTQYLGYLIGEVIYADRLAYFSKALGIPVDAYDLQKCGMPAVEATPASAAALADCLLP